MISRRLLLAAAATAPLAACAERPPHFINQVSIEGQPAPIGGARLAAFAFAGPEPIRVRDNAVRSFVNVKGVVPVRFELVDGYAASTPFQPSFPDRAGIARAGQALGCDVVIWGRVNQFEPYQGGPPGFVDVTVNLAWVANPAYAVVSGQRQANIGAYEGLLHVMFDEIAGRLP
ncbi:MAG: hypothetical protein J0H82_13015 [Alphaproteobacteria bacterium]|jgi:hypothetical protein|nr:hypothetical protein [Alphaproteobacteria bacterium]